MTDPKPEDGEAIPHPPEHWYGLLGNLPDIDPKFLQKSMLRLADIYGPIYKINLIARQVLVISNYELAKEVHNDDHFCKEVGGALAQIRDFAGDGLFTAFNEEPNWAKAHRLLMPIFGPMGVRKMLPDMIDISAQMIAKWDRLGPDNEITASDEFTRLAFDTIGLCGYGYRFNEFYSESVHPFATWMAENLSEAGKISLRTTLETKMRIYSAQKYKDNCNAMKNLCRQMIEDRKKHPQPDRHDLLSVMMRETDPVTGEKLEDENIIYQMITFLIAGHETTSGTTSFLFYHLLKNPETWLKAQREVDEVLGNGPLEVNHISKLKYINACIKETLRFQGPIGLIVRVAKRPYLLGGKYYVDGMNPIMISLPMIHKDPAVWGDDAAEFKPERMIDTSKYDPGAWRPFGVGARSCIGRAFAEQEIIASVALILQRFQIEMADPSYDLKMISNLTIKPDGFKFKVRRRPDFKGPIVTLPGAKASAETSQQQTAGTMQVTSGRTVTVLYGSNAGTCHSFASEFEAAAPKEGFRATIKTLDEMAEDVPKGPVVVIVPSYEGKPPDNAKKLVAWLESKKEDRQHLKGIRFSVFGVGNSEWASSFHRVPRFIDEQLTAQGAERVCDSVFADVKENAIGEWEDWLASYWGWLRKQQGSQPSVGQSQSLKAEVIKSGTPSILAGNDMSYGIVRENKEIADTTIGPAKRHMDIELPKGTTYQTGAYLQVLPLNPPQLVDRVLRRFDIHSDDQIQIEGTRKTYLLFDTPKTAYEFFACRVDLNNVATQRQLKTIAAATTDAEERARLECLGSSKEQYHMAILEKRCSVLDVLEDHPSSQLGMGDYIDMLQSLAPRQYSISSSSLSIAKTTDVTNHDTPVRASVTYDVSAAPARSGHDRTFQGVCSTYLSTRTIGARIRCAVRSTNISFHLPPDPKTPIIMIAAGTGIAPMRGFIQERAAIASARGPSALGPALLYFGCRHHQRDYLYHAELQQWENDGVVSVRPAFSRQEGNNWHYVPERMWDERHEIAALYRGGAKIFLCGSAAKLAKSAHDVLIRIWMEPRPEKTRAEAEAFIEGIREDRYVTDVFS